MQFGWRPQFLWAKPNHFNDTYHRRVDLQSLSFDKVLCQTCCQMCQLPSEHNTWVKKMKHHRKTSEWQLCHHACCQTARLLVTLAQYGQRQHLILSCKCAWYAWRCFASYRTSCAELNRSMHWSDGPVDSGMFKANMIFTCQIMSIVSQFRGHSRAISNMENWNIILI